jgi:hypothetical protein
MKHVQAVVLVLLAAASLRKAQLQRHLLRAHTWATSPTHLDDLPP